jgi:hypothetical protein
LRSDPFAPRRFATPVERVSLRSISVPPFLRL